MFFYSIYLFLSIFFSELVLRHSAYGSIGGFSWMLAAFSALAGLLLGLICSVFRKKAGSILLFVFESALFLYYTVNLIYQHTFKSFLSVIQIGMGGDALTSFGHETLLSALEVKWYLLLLLLPLVLLIITVKKATLESIDGLKLKQALIVLLVIVLCHCGIVLAINNMGDGAYSAKDLYNDTFVLPLSVNQFGMLTSTRLELRGIFFGTGSGSFVDESGGTGSSEESVYPLNALDIDFASLAESTEDERLKSLDEYFSGKSASYQNEYTGMFEGYNLVTILCESYSPYLLDKDRTPTLWKMAHEGIVFRDYYSTICDNTSNSEYAMITGLLPDASLLGKGWNTFYEFNSCTTSKDNYFPLCMGNQFKAKDLQSLGFHNYYGTYYGRKDTHPNFGYDFYYMTNGLKYTEDWPTSDLEMMQQALEKIDMSKQFNAYFLSFSGHMYYRFDSNRIARINKGVTEGIEKNESIRAYVACNQELEKAVTYLVEKLEENGVLDKTLIVLAPDHYPYTLGFENLSQIAGRDLTADEFEREFNQYKGCLMMWTPGMEDTITVEDPVCELDVLPTLLNLFGMEFDSRLLMGRDVFSEVEPVAVLMDRSFVTKDFYYNANSGEITVKEGCEEPDPEEAEDLINLVKNKFAVSTEMLYGDYYSHVYNRAD